MAQKSCIPGYDEAIAEERRIREEAFLGKTATVCGIEINQITPYLLARLFRSSSPFFYSSSEKSPSEIIHFLWTLSPQCCEDMTVRQLFIDDTLKRVADIGIDVAIAEIERFIDDTFLDAPEGGQETVPYACSIAWMVHRMACKPHEWDEERTLNSPIRRIYQYIKCGKLDNGEPVFNSISDWVKDRWLHDFRNKATLN